MTQFLAAMNCAILGEAATDEQVGSGTSPTSVCVPSLSIR